MPKTRAAVERLWPGSTIVCVASGPSLTQEDVDAVRGRARVIVVNTSYLLALWADVLYACDGRWWDWHKGAPTFTGLKFGLKHNASGRWRDVQLLEHDGIRGLSTRPTHLRTGINSGYQAMNLAYLLGAARILLLGYDMQPSKNGRDHWHPDHPHRSRSSYRVFAEYFASLVEPLQAAGVEVVNCTRRTALTCFPTASLEEAIQRSEVAA